MNASEARGVLAILATEYPEAYKNVDVNAKVGLWAVMFADDSAEDVVMGVRAYMATDVKGFAPKVGQIKAEIVKVKTSGAPAASDVWNHIRKAISNSGYHSVEEFEALSPVEQRIVGSPRQLYDWGQMDVDTLDSVVASNVQRAYRTMLEDEKYRMALPPSVSSRITQLAESTFRRLTDGK